MTIDIALAMQGNIGTNFNAYVDSFVDTFTSSGFPFFEQDDQMVIVGANTRATTKIFTLDGADLAYDFPTHTVSGRLDSVALGTLGGSYNANGSFDLDGQGHISGHSPVVTFGNLDLVNPRGVRGDVHEIVAELMYLGGTEDRGLPTFLGKVFGEAHNVTGSGGGDTYVGTGFADRVAGLGGNDVVNGAGGNDTVDGGLGNDNLRGLAGNDSLLGGEGNDRIGGDTGADALFGGNGNDRLDGGTENDRLLGDAGNDQLFGGAGLDTLTGGAGKDALSGGTFKDLFVFTAMSDSPAAARDVISDFERADTISLTAVDANSTVAGNQNFAIVSGFTGVAGQLSYSVSGSNTFVYADVNGDRASDFGIVLSRYTTLTPADFLL